MNATTKAKDVLVMNPITREFYDWIHGWDGLEETRLQAGKKAEELMKAEAKDAGQDEPDDTLALVPTMIHCLSEVIQGFIEGDVRDALAEDISGNDLERPSACLCQFTIDEIGHEAVAEALVRDSLAEAREGKPRLRADPDANVVRAEAGTYSFEESAPIFANLGYEPISGIPQLCPPKTEKSAS